MKPGDLCVTKHDTNWHNVRNHHGTQVGKRLLIKANEVVEIVGPSNSILDVLSWIPRQNVYVYFATNELTVIYEHKGIQ